MRKWVAINEGGSWSVWQVEPNGEKWCIADDLSEPIARLAAAAPKMLKALKEIYKSSWRLDWNQWVLHNGVSWSNRAEKAITAAEGRKPA